MLHECAGRQACTKLVQVNDGGRGSRGDIGASDPFVSGSDGNAAVVAHSIERRFPQIQLKLGRAPWGTPARIGSLFSEDSPFLSAGPRPKTVSPALAQRPQNLRCAIFQTIIAQASVASKKKEKQLH